MTRAALPPEPSPTRSLVRKRVFVEGAVQGVGFRPFVHRNACALGLTGWVMNTPQGVVLEAEGPPERVQALLRRLESDAPPNATITSVRAETAPLQRSEGFVVRPSTLEGASTAQILPDLAACEDCLNELFDPGDRRFRYPFINCTQCGPRFSIMTGMPYDRARTSMRRFTMCAACQAEYDDPTDRRFHAEPNACPTCGPQLRLLDPDGVCLAATDEALAGAAKAIGSGSIVAVKGIGGFHLMVDASDSDAVLRLRARKRRSAKPFALMFPHIAALRKATRMDGKEQALLTGPERPIVLLRRKGVDFAEAIGPANPWIGAILPYTPLHHLLMRALDRPIVATSANLTDEPIVIDTDEALERLNGIADMVLSHDRPIVRPVEDSVLRVVCGRVLPLRRARGFAPAPLALAGAKPGILGVGGHLKTTIAQSSEGSVILWPHIGDLNSVQSRAAHERAVQDMRALTGASHASIARDLHPDYASSQAADNVPSPKVAVQHHVAHIAACLADNGMTPPALGVAWDGAGFGPDGTIWGGEFLALEADRWRRVATLRPFRLPGGEVAMREPRRAGLGLLYEAFGQTGLAMADLAPVAAFTPAQRNTLGAMLARGVNAPICTSAGRLFDAVAAIAGLAQHNCYEGQAACELEWVAGDEDCERAYSIALRERSEEPGLVLDWGPALEVLLEDVRAKVPARHISAAFHNGLIEAIVAVAQRMGQPRVALSGGCFQSARLLSGAVRALRRAGFEPLWHHKVPPNDGGLALGQVAYAAWRNGNGEDACA